MSLSDLIAADVAGVFLNADDFAVEVRQYVGGESSNQRRLTGIVTWYPTAEMDDRGRATKRRGELLLSSDAVVTVRDAFRIGDDLAQVEAIDQKQDGALIVRLTQTIPETRGAKPVRVSDL